MGQMKYLLILFSFVSCNFLFAERSELVFEIPQDMSETISFKQLKEEVLNTKCVACHGNAGGVNLESHASAHKHLDAIRRSTLQTKTMPKSPVGGLTRRQHEVLDAWITAGGPDSPVGGERPEEDESRESEEFKAIKDKVIIKKCLSCHLAGEQAGNIPLGTREELLTSGLVKPGNPEGSPFYTITIPGTMNMMPPYPVDPLTNVQRRMIEIWIRNGAN